MQKAIVILTAVIGLTAATALAKTNNHSSKSHSKKQSTNAVPAQVTGTDKHSATKSGLDPALAPLTDKKSKPTHSSTNSAKVKH